ncbi:MAG: L-histidine N(alpha)-methyltransferase [Microthrixaceae bacterium]|nr:L-histidine N(alpha)-methyltransferase [Microthrixaceae bacterium]
MTTTDPPTTAVRTNRRVGRDEGGSPIRVDVHLDRSAWSTHLAEQTLRGLRDDPPWIPPVWFYDEPGSAIFEEITRLEEYYPTEAEREILATHAAEIAETTGVETLAELGSGTSDKTALLLDAGEVAGTLKVFAPFDCSEEVLRRASAQIAATRPDVAVHAVVGDFNEHLWALPTEGACVLAFLGSTIGNLGPSQRKGVPGRGGFDAGCRRLVPARHRPGQARRRVLIAAYDDAAGVTARFNLNALSAMNKELPGGLRPGWLLSTAPRGTTPIHA